VNNTGGTISANAQTLLVSGSTVNGGTVALTGASTLQLSNGTVQSGTLNNSATGTIEALSFTTDTLGGTISNPAGGVIKIDNGAALKLQSGSYFNAGGITLNSTGNTTELMVNGSNVTLTGGGSVTLSNNANNFILGAASTDMLTNQETIQGAGNIGNGRMGLVNSGTILANQGTALIIQPDSLGFTNNGTLSVSSGDTLHVSNASSGPFSNFVGNTLTGGTYNVSGTLQIDQLGNTGGEIVTNAANILLNGSTSSFVDAAGMDALTKLNANSTASSGFAITGGRNFTTAGNFTNNGTLTVGSGSKFDVNGNLTNFSGTTLTGGTYNVTGTLQFNNANIVTNAANITLTGASSQILNQSSGNGLANFATNNGGASFTVAGGRVLSTSAAFTNNGSLTITGSGSGFTTGGNLSNAGSLTIGTSSTFTLGGTASTFTQTAGTTTDDGTLTLPSAGKMSVNGGSVFGNGTISGAVASSGTITPGDSSTATGILTDKGAYTQNPTGKLDISIGGTTAGKQYDVFNPTTASLGGALNTTLINGFTPSIGQTFTIMNVSSKPTGTFASCDGRTGGTTCPINSSEHFTITYNPTSVVLTVAAGAAPVVGQFKSLSGVGPSHITVEPGRFGWGRYGGGRNFAHLGSQFLALAAVTPPKGGALLFAPQAQSGALIGTTRSRTMVDFSGGSRFTEAGSVGLETRAIPIPLHRSTLSSTRLPASPRAYLGRGVISAWELASTDSGRRQNVLNRIATFAPARSFSVGTAPHSLMRAGAGSEIHNRINPAAAAMRINGHTPKTMAPKSLVYNLDLLSILGTSPRQALKGLLGQPGNPNTASVGYLSFSGTR
jgi:hypothetical protein